MLSKDLEASVTAAFEDARKSNKREVTIELLLVNLINIPTIQNLLVAYKVNPQALQDDLDEADDFNNVDYIEEGRDTMPNAQFQRVLQRSIFFTQSAGRSEVEVTDALVAIFSESASAAASLMTQYRLTREQVLYYITNGKASSPKPTITKISSDDDSGGFTQYVTDLNEKVRLGKIDPIIGRTVELDRIIQTLSKRKKNNVILVGDAGVGKTALAEGLAAKIVNHEVTGSVAKKTIFSLDISTVVAGTKYRGDLERRVQEIIAGLKAHGNAILFIDEIHDMIGAGAASGSIDIAGIMKPALASGELSCIGTTTYTEYRQIFTKDAALDRRFQKIDIKEPTIVEAVEIVKGLRPKLEHFHELRYAEEALVAAVRLSDKYLSEKRLPDKALDLLDEAAAYVKLKPETSMTVEVKDIEKILAQVARIPEKNVSRSEKDTLRVLGTELKAQIFGQDSAVDELHSAIKLARCGLRTVTKPIGSFLFVGPTGVGKTELAKQLANTLGVEFIRFDMSEYSEAFNASKLVGSPPGYVGYEQGGLLTEAINKHPHSVLLLDEIEKAHPDIYNILLQIMDHGTCTDSNGRKSDFRHVILIMTSNAGASEATKESIGFTQQDNKTDMLKAVKAVFTPEFRNRLDAVVQFEHLNQKIILNVVDKFLMELELQLEASNVILHVTQEARELLGNKGYDRAMGARPMARVIQDEIKKPLSDALLFGELENGGHIHIGVKRGKLVINVEALKYISDK